MAESEHVAALADDEATAGAITSPAIQVPVSGLYATAGSIPGLLNSAIEDADDATADAAAAPIIPKPIQPLFGEELRLDVDGAFPLMVASGTIPISKVQRLSWVARVKRVATNNYRGGILYRDPASATFPYTTVDIKVTGTSPAGRMATATFTGSGLPARVVSFAFRSRYFHSVEFEFDSEVNIAAGLSIQTHAHPNRPATLPSEVLSIQTVYQRAGFNVSTSANPSVIPAPPGTTWSDMEMHDAMTAFWSRFSASARWAMWVLFARRHETGANLGGVMFDDIGPNHRQGTAIFYDSFISSAPAGDPNPAAWVGRMRFWTAVHEMGHAFNLAHSWQKALGTPWIPLANEPEARSYMNYPYNVAGGQTAFFADFAYRFSNPELTFMRHAPAQFVRMGDAAWFDHHGFEQAAAHPAPPLSLEIRFNRRQPVFEFLEPVVAELKLKNISNQPQVVNANVLSTLDGITLAIKREGAVAKQHAPYARYCMSPAPRVLKPGESMYGSVFMTASLSGIDVAEPGRYVLQAALHQPQGDIVSAPATLRIARPQEYDEEVLAQDFFTDGVGRVLAFDGSNVLGSANATLRQVSEQLPNRRVAKHALIPLALAVATPSQVLDVADGMEPLLAGVERQKVIRVLRDRPTEARADLTAALMGAGASTAAESLGHVDYKVYVDDLTDLLASHGEGVEAVSVQQQLRTVLASRGAAPHVLAAIDARIDALQAGKITTAA